MVTDAVGDAGGNGSGLTTRMVVSEIQPVDISCAKTLYEPGANPEKIDPGWYVTPPTLYSMFAPVGAVMEIVPVGVVQSGCDVTEAVGFAGGVQGDWVVKLPASK